MNNALLIFIKNLEKGKVKTRLASTLGEDKAFAIYQALLKFTRDLVTPLKVERLLFYSDFIVKGDEWSEKQFKKFVQEGSDLGDKMSKAFERAFQDYGKVVIIGSDCASLTGEIIERAFQLLDSFPFVVGPATDGGYYLLGMNRFSPAVFKNIEWSTPQVLPKTLEIIESLGHSCSLLPELSDIDYQEDWEKFGWEIS